MVAKTLDQIDIRIFHSQIAHHAQYGKVGEQRRATFNNKNNPETLQDRTMAGDQFNTPPRSMMMAIILLHYGFTYLQEGATSRLAAGTGWCAFGIILV